MNGGYVGILSVELHFPEAGSLKGKRKFVKSAKAITQFMDRDTRPDFASTVMIPAIQSFIKNPKDIDGLTNSIEAQKKSIFGS